MKQFISILFVTIALIAAALAWQVRQSNEASSPQKSQIPIERLIIKGSNTVGEKYAPQLAESFLKSQHAILVRTKKLESAVEKVVTGFIPRKNKRIEIMIYAHGSSTGFRALAENSTDLAMSSRAVKPEEREALTRQYGQLIEYPIALDALGIVKHPDNAVDALTIPQIAAIFSGEINNWQQLGGADLPIQLFARDNNSGTWDTFKHLVLKRHGKTLSDKAERFESSSELVEKATQTPGGIGFVGASYIKNVPLIKIKGENSEQAYLPNAFTIGTMHYPLSRKLYFYQARQPGSELARQFLAFVNTNRGQANAPKVGLVSYFPTISRPVVSADWPAEYRELASLGNRLTATFASTPEGRDPGHEARELERLAHYHHQFPLRRFVLVATGSTSRLPALRQMFISQQLPVLDTLELTLPSASSQIEVWVL